MSHNLAKLNYLNSVDRASIKGDRSIDTNTVPDRFRFINTGQWMLLLLVNVVCLTFVAFACILFKGSV